LTILEKNNQISQILCKAEFLEFIALFSQGSAPKGLP
jgi:hypothetical protein